MIYLDTPSTGLISTKSKESIESFNTRMSINPAEVSDEFRNEGLPKLRSLISEFTDSNSSDFALIPNTSFGLNTFLSSLKGIQKVLLYEKEYQGLTMPFDLRDFNLSKFGDIDGFSWNIDEIKKLLINQKIELFVFSETQWLSGYRADVKEICSFCREHNILTIVDYSQSLGSLSFSFENSLADVALSSNYKWMNAGFGSGIMWIKPEVIEKFKPVLAGYNSAAPLFDFDNFKPTIKCYEPGHLNLHAFSILIESLKEKLKMGAENIEKHNLGLAFHFINGMNTIGMNILGGFDNRSSIVVIKNKDGLKDYLSTNQIICRERGEGIRFGFHYHNTLEEVDRCIEILADFS